MYIGIYISKKKMQLESLVSIVAERSGCAAARGKAILLSTFIQAKKLLIDCPAGQHASALWCAFRRTQGDEWCRLWRWVSNLLTCYVLLSQMILLAEIPTPAPRIRQHCNGCSPVALCQEAGEIIQPLDNIDTQHLGIDSQHVIV